MRNAIAKLHCFLNSLKPLAERAAKNLEKSASQSAETLISQGLDVEHLPSRCSRENQREGVTAIEAAVFSSAPGAPAESAEKTYQKLASEIAETQTNQLFQENTFAQGVLYKPEERCSADANFCLSTLAALESPEHSSITSSDQVIELFCEMETRGQRCNDELPEGFWERVAFAVGLLCEQFESQSQANSEPAPLTSYSEGQEVWFFHPFSEQKWLKGTVQAITQNLIRVSSGVFGRMIQSPNEICHA
jgi:hypothetical protein